MARGTAVNFIGVVAKAMHPLFFIAMTRVFGPDVFGVYVVANTIIEMGISFTFSGFETGVLLFASRHVHAEDERDIVYQVMANGLVVALGLTALSIALAFLAGPPLFAHYYRNLELDGLSAAVQIMALGLPFVAIPLLVVSATKSLMIMKYDVILLGALRPGGMLAMAVFIYFIEPTVVGMAWAFLLSNVLVTIAAAWVYGRHFEFGPLAQHLRRFRLHRPLMVFSIPQSLNQTLVNFTAGISVLILGAAGLSQAMIAFFGTGAEIVRQVKQARIAFSRAFTPVISRLHREERFDELREHFSTVSRWVVIVTIPILLLVLAFKSYLLLLFHESYTHDAGFMDLLAVGVFFGGLFGLAANVVAMTGHSTLNLINSVVVSAVGFALNYLFIPWWGLYGAALATSLAVVCNVALTSTEIYLLYRIVLSPRAVWKPLVAGVGALLAYVLLHLLPLDGLALSVVLSVVSVGVFAALLALLGLEARDGEVLRSFGRNKRLS